MKPVEIARGVAMVAFVTVAYAATRVPGLRRVVRWADSLGSKP